MKSKVTKLFFLVILGIMNSQCEDDFGDNDSYFELGQKDNCKDVCKHNL